jgi:myo-inositol-1(or 4)-monophosphatase
VATYELQSLLTFAEETARRAGALLREAYDLPVSITNKGEIDLVTQTDRDSEALILAAIKERYPSHGILAEEGGEISADAPDGTDLMWIIDPLDGTTNFAHKFPVFAVSVALRDRLDVLIGVVYDPLRDECFTAARGMGASLNGKPIQVTAVGEMHRALLATGFPYDAHHAPDNNSTALSLFLRRVQGLRRAGSAALDLAYVAAGRLDGFWEMSIFPWDLAAGSLLVREAGGQISDYDGDRDINRVLSERRIVASNGLIHSAMVDTLREVYATFGAE